LLRTVDPSATQNRIVNFGTLDLGSPEGVRKFSLSPCPSPQMSDNRRSGKSAVKMSAQG
jgi:hypothetical protein